jgi:hypothetical protein
LRADIPDYRIETVGKFIDMRDTNIKVQLFDVIAHARQRPMRGLAQHGRRS